MLLKWLDLDYNYFPGGGHERADAVDPAHPAPPGGHKVKPCLCQGRKLRSYVSSQELSKNQKKRSNHESHAVAITNYTRKP